MNGLRAALAVLEERQNVHSLELVERVGSYRVECMCGWEGEWRGWTNGDLVQALRDGRDHLGDPGWDPWK